jgi:hypothetical protein
MGQPTPPGDSPLVEGLDASWNEFVSYIPEDKRAEFAPKFRERLQKDYEPLRQWESLQKSGVTPESASTALSIYDMIEQDPRKIYDAIGNHLGITPQQAQEVMEVIEDDDGTDPEIAALKEQVEVLGQIALAQRQQTSQERLEQQQAEALDQELAEVKKKYGDYPEDEIIMRMAQLDMTAEEAYNHYNGRVAEIQKRRPAPMIMGGSGAIPSRAIDPKKLSSSDTRNVVAQMLDHANAERNK